MEKLILFFVSALMTSAGIYCFGKARDHASMKHEIAGLVIMVTAGLICLYRTVVNENMLFAITGSFCVFELGDSLYRLFIRRNR